MRCDDLSGGGLLPGHYDGILLAVAVLDRGGVLVPVGELRPVLGEHQSEPLLMQAQDITDMTAMLQGRLFPR